MKNENSVALFVNDFPFYFYIEAPSPFDEEQLKSLKDAFNVSKESLLLEGNKYSWENYLSFVLISAPCNFKKKAETNDHQGNHNQIDIEITKKYSIYGFEGFEKKTFLKIYSRTRSQTLKIKNILLYILLLFNGG